MEEASKLGIKSPESYYDEGKNKGRLNRDRGIEGQKTDNKVVESSRKSIENKDIEKNPDVPSVEKKVFHPIKKPTINDRPSIAERIRVSEIPRLLSGFKFLMRK